MKNAKNVSSAKENADKRLYGIFKVMAGKHVTVRLLDSPYMNFYHIMKRKQMRTEHFKENGIKMSKTELQARIIH